MRTFSLMRGADMLTLDDAGQVARGGVSIGQWTTNDRNQIVVTQAGSGATPIDVDWRFDGNNHLCIDQNGRQVFDILGDKPSQPALRIARAVLFVKPVDVAPFEFALHATWALSPTHDLAMTVNGKTSTIDGVINDRNSAFRFRFGDKVDPIETYSLLFEGAWRNSPDPAQPGAVIYEYLIEGSATPGVFTLPNKLIVDNNEVVLAYAYDKAGRTQTTQLVGNFSFDNFELKYVIERKTAGDGVSTMLRFDVDVKGKSVDGKVIFALKRTDSGAVTTTELAIGGTFTARFKSGVLTIGLQFSQRTINGTTAAKELTFGGKLVNHGGAEFTWELKAGTASTTISIAADQIRFGGVALSGDIGVEMSGGGTKSVKALFGVSF